MSSKFSLLALGFGVYLAAAIASFPAAIAERWFAPEELSLAVVEGTIWHGTAAYGAVAGIEFSDVEWWLHPAALLRGRLSVTAETDLATGFARTNLTASGNRLLLTAVRASTDLRTFRDLLAFGEVRGEVNVALESLELVDGWPVAAIGEIQVADLSVPPLIPMNGITTIALGNYRARLTVGDEPGIVALLSDQGGPLELTGRVDLRIDRTYLFDSLIKPRADAPAALVQGLEFVSGAPNASGQRKFVQQGTL
jgi:hypothetical protein